MSMNIILNNKNNLVESLLNTQKLGLPNGVYGISNEVDDVVGGQIANNSYSYNNNYKAIRVNDSSTNAKGCLSIPLGYFSEGDIINVKCDVMNISGDKVKIAIDSYRNNDMSIETQNVVGSSDIFQTKESNVFEVVNINITCKYNGWGKLVIGTFTSDIGDYYIRDINVGFEKPNRNFERIVKTNRMYTFNGTLLASDFSFDTCRANIDSGDSKTFLITHDKPFSCELKRGVSIVKTNANEINGKLLEIRSSSEQPNTLKIKVYDNNTNDYVHISTALTEGVWFSVIQYGYDYIENV